MYGIIRWRRLYRIYFLKEQNLMEYTILLQHVQKSRQLQYYRFQEQQFKRLTEYSIFCLWLTKQEAGWGFCQGSVFVFQHCNDARGITLGFKPSPRVAVLSILHQLKGTLKALKTVAFCILFTDFLLGAQSLQGGRTPHIELCFPMLLVQLTLTCHIILNVFA